MARLAIWPHSSTGQNGSVYTMVENKSKDDLCLGSMLLSAILLIPVMGMHAPASGISFSLLPALLVIALRWKSIQTEPELKRILILLVVYLGTFTALSDDVSRSIKGVYDIFRGLIHFPIALLLCSYARSKRIAMLIPAAATCLILAHFLFPRDDFFGFYENPNNVAVTLTFLIALLFPALGSGGSNRSRRHLLWLMALIPAFYLLLLTNSRAAWLACAVAAGVMIMIFVGWRLRTKLVVLGLMFATLAVGVIFFNYKGVELSLRDVIWEALFFETFEERPWFGYGINYAKELMPTLDFPFQTTHNIFLELFVSSGFVGLAVMLYVFYRLAKHYLKFSFEGDGLMYAGVFGLIAFLVMDQFDLKFASYRFFGSHCFLLGLIYAHRCSQTNKERGRRDGDRVVGARLATRP